MTSVSNPKSVLVYGELDMNLIDGSSIWLQALCRVLAQIEGVSVDVLLRVPERRDVVLGSLHENPSIDVIEPMLAPGARLLDHAAAVRELARLDAAKGYDVVFLRGRAVTEAAVRGGVAPGRLWTYLVPLPGNDREQERAWLEPLAHGIERIACQTPAVRSLLRRAVPRAAGKLFLLPPAIPELGPERIGQPFRGRLLYAGKIAPEYSFLETVGAFGRLRRWMPDAELHVAGDKVHDPPGLPEFRRDAERALRKTDGLVWHGGTTREQVATLAEVADAGLSLRLPELSRSLELSTKVLEYAAAGATPVLNRAPAHVDLLGEDYSGFADSADELVRVLERWAAEPQTLKLARTQARTAAAAFTFDAAADRLAAELEPGAGDAVIVAGHQLSFLAPVMRRLGAGGLEIVEDLWRKHDEHDEDASRVALAGAAAVICEWCLGNAVWYAGAVAPDQRLIVHFHRSELESRFPPLVDHDRVDRFVFVAEHVRSEAIARFGWSRDKTLVIPNPIATGPVALPKLPGADFNLGMVGWVPRLKRLDRVLDILERLRAADPRYRLIVKGQSPESYAWMTARSAEREYYERQYERVGDSPLLRNSVSFEPHGDLAEFFRKCGFVVSASDIEGNQVSVAEGMASGCVPVVIDRPGASDQYAPEWIHRSPAQAARAILALQAAGDAARAGRRAAEAVREVDTGPVAGAWASLLAELGVSADRVAAR